MLSDGEILSLDAIGLSLLKNNVATDYICQNGAELLNLPTFLIPENFSINVLFVLAENVPFHNWQTALYTRNVIRLYRTTIV
ncbi:MAG: hypothetical protein L6262_04490 [Weeksellaceae bacterium]|nr:hypothetical protein [Weeksellaceae bacterium]